MSKKEQNNSSDRGPILYSLIGILTLISVTLAIFNFILLSERNNIDTLKKDPAKSSVEMLKEHILIDNEEEPTQAVIEDLVTLKQSNPQFYKNAKVGDKLFIYSDKIIIFREEEDLIINMVLLDVPTGNF